MGADKSIKNLHSRKTSFHSYKNLIIPVEHKMTFPREKKMPWFVLFPGFHIYCVLYLLFSFCKSLGNGFVRGGRENSGVFESGSRIV